MPSETSDQLNILVVDDDETSRNVIVDIVSRHHHQAVPAESAEEILKLLPFWTFQIAFIDQHLPGMEGIMLGEYLRKNNPYMTIAIVTGAPEPALEKKSEDLGLEFIAKPFGVSQILDVIDKYRQQAVEREQARWQQGDDDFVPPISRFTPALEDFFEMPNVPSRIESRLTETIKRSLNNLRSVHRYNEKDRIIALSGLISAKVLGIRLPKSSSNRTLFEEYDALMLERGRRREFGE
jgi:DNA-binding NtrC family response regulator